VQETDENARGKGKTRGKQHPTWVTWLFSWVQRADQESYTCYVLFALIFILDFSLLTMLFPVSLAAYALATQRPSRLYWQVGLLAVHCIGLHRVLCCAVLCCAVLCCAVLCCADAQFCLAPLNCLDALLEVGVLVELLAGAQDVLLLLDFCQILSCTHAVHSVHAHMSESLSESKLTIAQIS